MPFVYDKLLKFVAKFIVGVVAIVVVVSLVVAFVSEGAFIPTLGISLFIGGMAVLFTGALVGAGLSERSVHNAAYMTGGHHSKYFERVHKERFQRRDDQFFFMLLMAGSGFLLIIIAYFIM